MLHYSAVTIFLHIRTQQVFPSIDILANFNLSRALQLLLFRLTVPLESKLPPSRETRLVSLETRLERNETSLVSREYTGSTNTSHSSYSKPVLCIRRQYRIISISAVDMIFILISNACVPCVCYKFSSVQYCVIYIGQTFFIPDLLNVQFL